MNPEHPPNRSARHHRRQNEFGVAQRQCLRSDDARVGRRGEQDDHENDGIKTGPDDRGERQGQHHGGKRADRVE